MESYSDIVESAAAPWVDGGIDVRSVINANAVPHREVTYVAHVPGFVKVGRCNHLRRRFTSLQIGNPIRIRLLGYRFGNHEIGVHYFLEQCGIERAVGEWFVDSLRTRELLWLRGLLCDRGNHGR